MGAHLSSEPVPVRAPRLEECSSSETYGSKSSPEDDSAHGSDAIGSISKVSLLPGSLLDRVQQQLLVAEHLELRPSVLCCHDEQHSLDKANAVRITRFICGAEQTARCVPARHIPRGSDVHPQCRTSNQQQDQYVSPAQRKRTLRTRHRRLMTPHMAAQPPEAE